MALRTLKQFYTTMFFSARRSSSRERRSSLEHPSFIFSLTFIANNLIKGTQPRSRTSGAKFDVKGESLNEERNQEKGAREKEGCPEEEKVARALYKSEFQIHGPEQ
jgi:hypothetical protein